MGDVVSVCTLGGFSNSYTLKAGVGGWEIIDGYGY